MISPFLHFGRGGNLVYADIRADEYTELVRMISVRLATRRERKHYEQG